MKMHLLKTCHEDIVGSGGIAPHILNLGTRWRQVVSFMTWPLYSWAKSPHYTLDRVGGPQRVGLDTEVKRKHHLPAPARN